jgi:hypothetical protein
MMLLSRIAFQLAGARRMRDFLDGWQRGSVKRVWGLATLAFAAFLAGGAIAAVLLTNGNDKSSAQVKTVVRKETVGGRTVRETVTVATTAPAARKSQTISASVAAVTAQTATATSHSTGVAPVRRAGELPRRDGDDHEHGRGDAEEDVLDDREPLVARVDDGTTNGIETTAAPSAPRSR